MCSCSLCPVKYSPALVLIRGRVSSPLNQTYHLQNTHTEGETEGESICECVRGQLINTSAGINKPPGFVLDIDLNLFLCFPLFSLSFLHDIQMLYMQTCSPSTCRASCCTPECVWLLGQWWPGCYQALSVLHHMPPITQIAQGSQNKPFELLLVILNT